MLAEEPALHELDFDPRGFEWIDVNDADHSVISLERRGKAPGSRVVGVFNFTPVPRHGYLVGVEGGQDWAEIGNSDAPVYGGSGVGNMGRAVALGVPVHGRSHSLALSLPPLGALFLKPIPAPEAAEEAAASAADAEESQVVLSPA
jgi:1,4-alpha-glucan branching enzyme